MQSLKRLRSRLALRPPAASMSSSEVDVPIRRQVQVTNTLLYGIFASQKSYLIGMRCLMKREHADMLATRVSGHALPPELVDIIIEYLYEMEEETVRPVWIDGRKMIAKNIEKFEDGIYHSPALTSANAKMAAISVTTAPVQNVRPITGRGTCLSDPNETTYIHISCTRPSLALSLPPNFRAPDRVFSSAIFYNAGRGLVSVDLRPNDATTSRMHEDVATYKPARESVESQEEPIEIRRLIQCERVEDAIRHWDGEEVDKFVKLLGLVIVPFDEGDPMKPGLHLWQRILEV